MGGLSNAFWLWFPVLVYKAVSAFFRTIWRFNLWVLQTVSGTPLYYCKPEFRIPAITIGTFGNFCILNFLMFILTLSSSSAHTMYQNNEPLAEFLILLIVGIVMLFLCRILIRRGSI
jgi:hypothetical protein